MPALRRLLPWLPSIAYMALIWALSSQSKVIQLPDLPYHDKGAHFIEYAILGALFVYAIERTWPAMKLLKAMALAVLLTSAWGYFDEVHQAFVPNRNSDVIDWVADSLGAISGVSLMILLDRVVRRVILWQRAG